MITLLKRLARAAVVRAPRALLPLDRWIKVLAHFQWLREDGEGAFRYRYPIRRSDLVLDVGGYEGDFSDEVLRRFGCRIWIFEPVKPAGRSLIQRFADQRRVKVFGFGLAGKDQRALISLEGEASSVFHRAASRSRVEFKDASAFLRAAKPGRIRLLKLNIEGMEYDVVESLFKGGWLPKIDYLQIQFHEFVPHARARLDDIRRMLVKSHDLEWSFPWVWESWRLRK